MINKCNNTDHLNFERFKQDSKDYSNFLKKIIRIIPAKTMLNELKRRKIVKMNWDIDKFEEKKS